jgi:hypothetical protein
LITQLAIQERSGTAVEAAAANGARESFLHRVAGRLDVTRARIRKPEEVGSTVAGDPLDLGEWRARRHSAEMTTPDAILFRPPR